MTEAPRFPATQSTTPPVVGDLHARTGSAHDPKVASAIRTSSKAGRATNTSVWQATTMAAGTVFSIPCPVAARKRSYAN